MPSRAVMLARLAAALGAAAALAGCGKIGLTPDAGVDAQAPSDAAVPPALVVVADIVVQNRALDLLFVIDNSGSMAEEQATLLDNFSRLIAALEAIEGGLPDLHIGVVSTDLGAGPYAIAGCSADGDGGRLQSSPRRPGCQGPDGSYLIDRSAPGGGRVRNYSGPLSSAFSCIADLGTSGCGFEQPLESMRRALDGSNPSNAGFLRPDAALAVVIISDEDDCSTHDPFLFDTSPDSTDQLGPLSSFRCFEFGVRCDPDTPREPGPRQSCQPREGSPYVFGVQEYIDFLRQLKRSPGQLTVVGILGDETPVAVRLDSSFSRPELAPSCQSASGEAAPATRLHALLRGFPGRGASSSICAGDYSSPLQQVSSLLGGPLSTGCLQGAILDSNSAAPGIQHVCEVAEVSLAGVEAPLPACDVPTNPDASTNTPCHLIGVDVAQCADTPSWLAVTVHRGGVYRPPGTRVVARCQVE